MRSEPATLTYVPALKCVRIIDQTRLPQRLEQLELRDLQQFSHAIAAMQVRGAPLIGITAAYGLALSLQQDPGLECLNRSVAALAATRPTAVNLQWALQRVAEVARAASAESRAERALSEAHAIAEEDIAACRAIAANGLPLIQALASQTPCINIMTHCNAGRLAALEYGTALAPIYLAHEQGLSVHVWVSETRPRNQGASLTAWELDQAGVPFTLIADNAAGALMQSGQVDCCIVGSDRTAANGDVCNKIGTYMKAVAAQHHKVPFYVALPVSTIDWNSPDGSHIPIEERDEAEVLQLAEQPLSVADARACNPAFDVTPASLVTALITERGVVRPAPDTLAELRRAGTE